MGYFHPATKVEHDLHNTVVRFNRRPTVLLAAHIDDLKKQLRFWKRVARNAGVPVVDAPSLVRFDGTEPATVDRLMKLVRSLPPRSMRPERNAYLVEIEAIAASLRDGVTRPHDQTEPPTDADGAK